MDKKTKDITLRFRVDEDEYEKINNIAKKLGLKNSELIRNIIFGRIYSENMLRGLKEIPILENYARLLDEIGGKDYIFDNEVDNILDTFKIEKDEY